MLTWIFAAIGLYFICLLLPTTMLILDKGLIYGLGPRDGDPDPAGMRGRAGLSSKYRQRVCVIHGAGRKSTDARVSVLFPPCRTRTSAASVRGSAARCLSSALQGLRRRQDSGGASQVADASCPSAAGARACAQG